MTSPARKMAEERALKLKKKVGKQPKRIVGSTYVTKKGDTLSEIADKMGLTVKKIREANPKLFKQAKKMNEVPIGMKLKLPTVKTIGGTQDFASKTSPKKVYDLSKKEMEAIQMKKKPVKGSIGLNVTKKGLKPVPTGNKGLSKLPTPVRNKMGFMNKGSLATKKKTKSQAKGGKGVLVLSISVGKMKTKNKKKKNPTKKTKTT
tara:strand:+ start:4868 stop:5479 length:612 start_codon:yes stop_codon:yes gene_type:complete